MNGDAYRYTCLMILEAIQRSDTFLDVGGANGCCKKSYLTQRGLAKKMVWFDKTQRRT